MAVYIRDRKWVADNFGKNGEVVDYFVDDPSDIDTINTSKIANCSTALVISSGKLAIFSNGVWTWM